MPSVLFKGVIPGTLLTSYDFWQDLDGNIRGYPKIRKTDGEANFIANHSDFIIYLNLLSINHIDTLGGRGAAFHVTKVPVAIMKQRLEQKMLAKAGLKLRASQLAATLSSSSSLISTSSLSAQNSSAVSSLGDGDLAPGILIPHGSGVGFVNPFDDNDEEDLGNVIISSLPHHVAENRSTNPIDRNHLSPASILPGQDAMNTTNNDENDQKDNNDDDDEDNKTAEADDEDPSPLLPTLPTQKLSTTRSHKTPRKVKKVSKVVDEQVITLKIYELINIFNAPKGSASFQISSVLTRLESLAEILPWTPFHPPKSNSKQAQKTLVQHDDESNSSFDLIDMNAGLGISLNGALVIPHGLDLQTQQQQLLTANKFVQMAPDLDNFGLDEGLESVDGVEGENGDGVGADMYKKRREIEIKLLHYEIEIPSLKLGFRSQFNNHNEIQLYSVDHNELYISNLRTEQLTTLLKGIPHGLILQSLNHDIQILVPSFLPIRIGINAAPYSTELVLNRGTYNTLNDISYILYPVHTSHSFVFLPTLTSAIMLLFLRFLARDYDAVVKLLDSISTDTPYTTTQSNIYHALDRYQGDMANSDACAAILRLTLTTQKAVIEQPWRVQRALGLYSAYGYNRFVSAQNKLTFHDELSLLRMTLTEDALTHILPMLAKPDMHYAVTIACLYNRMSYLSSLLYQLPSYRVLLPPTNIHRPSFFTTNLPSANHFVVWYMDFVRNFNDFDALCPFTLIEPGTDALLLRHQQELTGGKLETKRSGMMGGGSMRMMMMGGGGFGGGGNKKKQQPEVDMPQIEMIQVAPPTDRESIEQDLQLLIPVSRRGDLPTKTHLKNGTGNGKYELFCSTISKLTAVNYTSILDQYHDSVGLDQVHGYGFLMVYSLLTDDMSFRAKMGQPSQSAKAGQILIRLLRDHSHKTPLNYILRLLAEKPELGAVMPKFSEYKKHMVERERQKSAQQYHQQKASNNSNALSLIHI